MPVKRTDWDIILKKAREIKDSKEGTLLELAKEYKVSPETISRRLNQEIESIKKVSIETLPEQELNRIARAELNLDKRRDRINRKSRFINTERRNLSIEEQVIENIKVKQIKFKEEKAVVMPNNNKKIIAIGDFHYVSDEETYNIDKLAGEVSREVNKGDRIQLLLSGDYIENKLHQDQIENKGTAVEQTMNFAQHLINIVGNVYKKADKLEVYMVAGNHDRVQRNKMIETREDTYAYILYKVLRNQFPNLYISYQPDRANFRMLNGEEGILIHGHREVKNSDKLDQWLLEHNAQNLGKTTWLFAGHFHKQTFTKNKSSRQNIVLIPSAKDENDGNNFEKDNNLRSITGFVVLSFDNYSNVIYKFVRR